MKKHEYQIDTNIKYNPVKVGMVRHDSGSNYCVDTCDLISKLPIIIKPIERDFFNEMILHATITIYKNSEKIMKYEYGSKENACI